MAGGKTETDPIILAGYCDSFKNGTKELFDKGRWRAICGSLNCITILRIALQLCAPNRRSADA